ncbi:uncharacterized mitochondrial protein-like protein [Tanacetum coccineum]
MNEFCAKKGIKREYSIARTPQQNGVAERKNRTLIEAARTMLADSLLPIQFWITALGKFVVATSQKERYLWGYSNSSKGYRVYDSGKTRKVQDCLHVDFLENQENQKGKGPDWMFDLELLTPSMNYIPVRKENYAASEGNVSTHDDVEDLDDQQFIVHGPSIHAAQPMHSEERTADKEVSLSSDEQALHDELVNLMHQESLAKLHHDAQRTAFEEEKKRIALAKEKECANSTFTLSTAKTPPQSTGNTPTDSDDDVPKDGVFSTNSFDDEHTDTEEDGAPWITTKDHTRCKLYSYNTEFIRFILKVRLLAKVLLGTNHKDQQTCLFACFLSQEEPKKVSQALSDESWVEAMQEELLQFKLQDVWVLCDLPDGKRVIEEVYVKQPPGFEDPSHPNKVYVDDIIFGSTKSSMVKDFEDLMQKEFKMSSMGELTFFLGLQVKQTSAGIFLSQDKYVKDILNKFDFRTIKPNPPLEAIISSEKTNKEVQVTPKGFSLQAVKGSLGTSIHQPNWVLWYPKDFLFIRAFSVVDYARGQYDRRVHFRRMSIRGRETGLWL